MISEKDIIVDHIPFSTAFNRRPNIKLNPTSITIHSTANLKSTAKGERGWLTNPSNFRTASWHYAVCDQYIVEAIPPSYVSWHSGDGSGASSGNMTSISIEMCESGDREKVLQRTKELVVYLMNKHNITVLKRHYDWNGKNCPRILNTDGKFSAWLPFKNDILTMHSDSQIASVSKVIPASPKPASSNLEKGDKGPAVVGLQTLLVKAGYKIAIDGDFGPATESAVRSFQAKNVLIVDGIAGEKTFAKLHEVTAPKPAPVQKQEGVILNDVWAHGKADFKAETRVKVLFKGEKVSIFGSEGDLYKIGANLYVSKKYVIPVVKPQAQTGVATGDVFTHSKADFLAATRDVVLKQGQSVGVYGEVNGMYKIRLQGRTLYVSKKYIKLK